MNKVILLFLLIAAGQAQDVFLEVKTKDGHLTRIPLQQIHSMSLQGNLSGLKPDRKDSLCNVINTFSLLQNYPNPFNPSTTIAFNTSLRAQVQVTIYDIMGRQVKKIADRDYLPGGYQLNWDGRDDAGVSVAAGAYFYQIRIGNRILNRKMLLIK